ncbi:hypothetical protein [Nocardia asteroides]|uniref:hypothetical protein n=1 Tax=Nocardia asteroides TaxID=1824 RepID=UPI001E3F5DCA|nr:hypothetical protein [Nocardia asteroides]UGT62284.1 hypothetical protein LTT61_02755 [Nocardia asteroides]
MTSDPPVDPVSADERAELERLRAEVAALRSTRRAAPGGRRLPHFWRWTAVLILTVLVAVLAISTVVSRYVRTEILDTDRYLSTVAPLASDPALQTELATAVTDEIFARADIEGLTAQALAALTDAVPAETNRPRVDRAVEGLAPVITRQARGYVDDTVLEFVRSDRFEDLWLQANRTAHAALVAAVTGDVGPEAVTVDENGTVTLSLAAVIDEVKARLLARGFTFAEKIPAVDKRFVLFRSPQLVRAQRAVDALDTAAVVLPWLTIAAAVAAIGVAPPGGRRRALSFVGLAIAGAMLVLAVALLAGRALYLDRIPPEVLAPDAARAIIDTLLVPLRTALRGVAVLGLVLAAVAYLTGGSPSAVAVRRGVGQGMDGVRRLRRSRPPNAVETGAFRARTALRCAIAGTTALLLVCWRYPTGLVMVWIVLGALLALLALELLIRPARGRPEEPEPKDDAVRQPDPVGG